MTPREKAIAKAAHEYQRTEPTDFAGAKDFINGAQWADKRPKNPWISVKEKLPKDGDIVLLHTSDYGIITALYDKAWKGVEVQQLFYCADKAREENECDYWCPIPELPKEGE